MFEVTKVGVLVLLITGGLQGVKHQAKAAEQFEVKLSLGKPIQVGQVTLVPIESTAPLARDEYLTLAEASKLGLVEIVEMPGEEQVNSLEVRNKSKLPILLFAGELLLGGKQDRIVAKDSIVPAHDRRHVPVFCVEHGRWEGKPDFQGGDTLVPDAVRAPAILNADQSVVWQKVAESNRAVAAAPPTDTLRGTLNDPKTKAASNRILDVLNSSFVSTPKTVGVMCCINGRIESADIYANASLFRQSRSKLFHSYALDAATFHARSHSSRTVIKTAECASFLSHIVSARRAASDRSQYGNTYSVTGAMVQGYESGTGRFQGGVTLSTSARPAAKAAGGGFSHGTYKPIENKTKN